MLAGGGSRDALDMRSMELERRLRAGEQVSESWREPGGFEKYTKVRYQGIHMTTHTFPNNISPTPKF